MAWSPQATVTIGGNTYTSEVLNGASITYGRNNIWDQPRAAYGVVEIINLDDSLRTWNLNDSLVIKIQNSSGIDVTVFTGTVSEINNVVQSSNSIAQVSVHRITALGPFAKMSRAITTGSWPKEYDDDRMDRIFTAASITVDVVDTPGVYEFTAINHTAQDCYNLATYYAGMALGYVYETTDGKVGYANESRRLNDIQDNGYFTIPTGSILRSGIRSGKTFSDVANDVILEYKANATETGTDANSIAAYGRRAIDVFTELEQAGEAQNQVDRYLALRAEPRINLSEFTIALELDALSSSQRNSLINVYLGKGIQINNLPTAIYDGTYKGFVEGWNLTINREQASLTLRTTEAGLSLVPERWQDVSATLIWSAVGATVQWQTYE